MLVKCLSRTGQAQATKADTGSAKTLRSAYSPNKPSPPTQPHTTTLTHQVDAARFAQLRPEVSWRQLEGLRPLFDLQVLRQVGTWAAESTFDILYCMLQQREAWSILANHCFAPKHLHARWQGRGCAGWLGRGRRRCTTQQNDI